MIENYIINLIDNKRKLIIMDLTGRFISSGIIIDYYILGSDVYIKLDTNEIFPFDKIICKIE